MIRIPYGISNYETLVGEGYIYIDPQDFKANNEFYRTDRRTLSVYFLFASS